MTESWKNVLGVLENPGIFCKQESWNPEGHNAVLKLLLLLYMHGVITLVMYEQR